MGAEFSGKIKKRLVKSIPKQQSAGMQEDYNQHSNLQASSFHAVQEALKANSFCFSDFQVDGTLRVAEFGCATGGNSKMYIDSIKNEVSKATGRTIHCADVVFFDQISNPWDKFQIDDQGIKFEFAKGSMYELELKKKYDVGFSNWALHWTNISKDERSKMQDAIWIQESSNEALKRDISKRSNKQLSDFLNLRFQEVNYGGVLVLMIQTSPTETQAFMNQAKKKMVEEEHVYEKKTYLTEKLVVPEYFRSEKDVIDVLKKVKNMWDIFYFEEKNISCPYGNDVDAAIACYNSFCNFQLENEDLCRFWEIVKELSSGKVSTATQVTILILKKKSTLFNSYDKADLTE